MPRLFIAIRPPLPIRDALLAIQDGVERARWQDDDQLHLTLRYIGDVDPRAGDDIVEALETVQARRFELALDGIGSFERGGRIETLWAGVTPHTALTALHHKLDHALVRLGLPPEGRAYRPHITLARGRMGPIDGFAAQHAGLTSAPFMIDTFGLYETTRGDSGSIYDEIARFGLA